MEEAYKLTTFYLQGQSDEPNWVTASPLSTIFQLYRGKFEEINIIKQVLCDLPRKR
jgi:hypothetical protein